MIGLGLGIGMSVGGVGVGVASPPTGISGVDIGSGGIEGSWTDAPSAPNGYYWEVWVNGGGMYANGGAGFGTSPTPFVSSGAPADTYYILMRTEAYPGFLASSFSQSGTFPVA